jgi:hypothetical protein
MTAVVAIVEGDGEVAALPILLRRVTEWCVPGVHVDIPHPIRVRRDRFLRKEDEFRRHLQLAAAKCAEDGWILVLLDADDDCPVELAPQVLQRAQNAIPHRRVSVVLASREYEAWFIAAAASLHGYRGFCFDAVDAVDAERPRNAKGWLSERMGGGTYREISDQPAFSARMDLQQAYDGSRSFRKLCDEWRRQFAANEV